MKSTYTTNEARWEALVQRDRQADGQFFYAVTTTGIYCRPGCSSKRPNRENVLFFDTAHHAESAGFRPCKRCQPDKLEQIDAHRKIIIQACHQIADSIEPFTLKELAENAGYSSGYFHRLFKDIVGVTPKQYAAEVRAKRLRSNLQTGANVTEAIYESGYNSSSRFYDKARDTLGMKPASYRQCGAGVQIRYTMKACYLGWVLIAATETGICAIEFADDQQSLEENLHRKFSLAEFLTSDHQFEMWVNQVLAFLDNPRETLDLPLDIQGTAFQQKVWQTLRQIPPGTTASYGQIARRMQQPKAARAVARACASNSIAVAIPCHRVVRQDGGMGGYRWGIERKQRLLEKESIERQE